MMMFVFADAGVDLGISVMHPLTGKCVPVFAADYVLGDYGTQAVMGVPGHSERDRQFAEQHQLPVVVVEETLESGERVLCNSAQVSKRVVCVVQKELFGSLFLVFRGNC